VLRVSCYIRQEPAVEGPWSLEHARYASGSRQCSLAAAWLMLVSRRSARRAADAETPAQPAIAQAADGADICAPLDDQQLSERPVVGLMVGMALQQCRAALPHLSNRSAPIAGEAESAAPPGIPTARPSVDDVIASDEDEPSRWRARPPHRPENSAVWRRGCESCELERQEPRRPTRRRLPVRPGDVPLRRRRPDAAPTVSHEC
jgi:hypothetical protein